MTELFANSGDPDQMLHYAAFDLGLHCLLITLYGVSTKIDHFSSFLHLLKVKCHSLQHMFSWRKKISVCYG